jgi:hypothetical protein
MLQFTNRAVITITAKEPFLRWVQTAAADSAHITMGDINEASHAYLVDDSEDGNEPDYLVRKNFKAIFEEELNGWYTDESMWPQKRDLKTFRQWFTVTIHSTVLDLGKKPPVLEEW